MIELPITPPPIMYLEFPAAEQPIGSAVANNLHMMDHYRSTFKTDLDLYDFAYANMKSDGENRFSMGLPWMTIAGRDGSMMLYHFGMTLRAFSGLLGRAPTFAKLVDMKAIEQAKSMFEGHFKDFYQVRQGVAHLADHTVTPDRRERHSVKKSNKYMYFAGPRREDGTIDESNNPGIFMRNSFHGHTFWGTVEGETVEYDLSQESVDKLIEIESVIFRAFQRASEVTLRSHQRRIENERQQPSD